MDLNYLKNTNLAVGQVLSIPEMFTSEDEMILPNYVNYVVKSGDTLYSIAKQFNVNVDTIIKDNVLTSNVLKVGQNLKIRLNDNNIIEECIGVDYTTPVSNTQTITYTVKKGDSLYSIAREFNTSVDTLININNLKSNNLSIGQVLKIPNVSSSGRVYTVVSGDNLYSIARKFNTSVDEIKKKNNLTSNLLSVGQKLNI